jgi:prepilin-type processing-associated H-X9-DG protein
LRPSFEYHEYPFGLCKYNFEKRKCGTYVGSYGFNAWLWRIPAGQSLIDNAQRQFLELPTNRADNIPILADCILDKALPNDTDTPPSNFEHPLPVTGSGVPGPSGAMAYYGIDRHRRAVNVVFLDGHAAPVPLLDLWKLQWNRTFTPHGVILPQPPILARNPRPCTAFFRALIELGRSSFADAPTTPAHTKPPRRPPPSAQAQAT